MSSYRRMASFKSPEALQDYLGQLGIHLPCDDAILAAPASPLAQPLQVCGRRVGNRFTAQPMEGWDGTTDGLPSPHTERRWRRFGLSGAKLIWGGEATAVSYDARANPNQLVLCQETKKGIAALLHVLRSAHRERFGTTDDLLVGLQLTHSGRFCRPVRQDRLEPKILYHHPLLDARCGITPNDPLLTDDEIRAIITDFVQAACLAAEAGFDFVDIKHCHGYLGHEFLSAVTRAGPYGGPFENRTRFLREVVAGIRQEAPDLILGVRVSAFDLVPFRPDPTRSRPGRPGPGVPEDFAPLLPYRYAFGADPNRPVEPDLTEPFRFLELLQELGIELVNLSAGSPYYNPHIQRPALFPPSDGYQPPEDPLVGVARQVEVTRRIKERFPGLVVVGTAYSYLQEYLPQVAQAVVRSGWADSVGLGRALLAYPDLPHDVLACARLDSKRLCRTFSDCTTAPRLGLISGCYPLDPYYRDRPEATFLRQRKTER